MTEHAYPPCEDSELLLEASLMEVKQEDDVLEVGVGSGFVSYNLKDKCRSIVGTDISPIAVKEAKRTGIEVIRTHLIQGMVKRFDLVLFNPPYLELEDYERDEDWMVKAIDGGKNGVEVLHSFLAQVKDVLAEEGRVILIVTSGNFPYIHDRIMSAGFSYEVVSKKRLFFEELYALKLTASSQ